MELYRIGQLAELANVSRRTIDYYTQLGLLTYEKTGSRYRYYTKDALDRLSLIDRYKKQNMPLTEIKERLQIWADKPVDTGKVLAKIDKISLNLKELEREFLELKPLLEKLDERQLKFAVHQLSLRGEPLISIMNALT